MSSSQIYEDQENRIPAQRRVKQVDPRTSNNVQASRRPVLGTINTNLRKQPTRAAKQGINYETGVPQQCDENVCPAHISSSSSQPSFSIHEDSPSCLPMGSTFSIHTTNSSSSLSLPLRERLCNQDNESESIPDLDPSITGLQKSSDIDGTTTSTDVMEMSVCEDDLMVMETTPREDVLQSRNDDIYDVPEYAADIYQYLREAEVCHKPRANYMSKQTDITASMRWILVDWLVEVAEEYSLHTETLYLAVSYIDRFLSHMSVKRDKLQLVGTTAMFIAAKYEEIYPPDVGQFAYITDNTYKVGQILRMEHLILKVLSFDMAVPTAHLFVNKFSRMCKNNEETLHLALFLAEVTMLDCDPFLRFLPSLIAASAVALANHTQGRVAWPSHMKESTGYTLEDLRECYVNLYRAFSRVHEPQQHAIRDKYRSSKWHGVSQLSPRQTFPW
ncbi:G2/mitotic-specific cyclin-A [Panulirus ornatus]|uniref:G2/mitotic-specific cyclin-A n=1 Tax=Panulirus ornatus TaxID=150431 RepID=UPI003A83C2EB